MDYKPLAEKLRPKSFDDVIGQDYLVGEDGIIRKMIENKSLVSIILFGNPGVGKRLSQESSLIIIHLNHSSSQLLLILKQLSNRLLIHLECTHLLF